MPARRRNLPQSMSAPRWADVALRIPFIWIAVLAIDITTYPHRMNGENL
jgi:hypothetical protein